MSPPPQGHVPQQQTAQPAQDANVRRVQQKWQPATADSLRYGQPQAPQNNPQDRAANVNVDAGTTGANTAGPVYAAPTMPQTSAASYNGANAAPAPQTSAAPVQQFQPAPRQMGPPVAPRAMPRGKKFGSKKAAQPAQAARQEIRQDTRQEARQEAHPQVRQETHPEIRQETHQETTREREPSAAVPPQQSTDDGAAQSNQTMAAPAGGLASNVSAPRAALAPFASTLAGPKTASRGLSGFERLFVKGNVRTIAAVTFGNDPRARSKVTSALTAALLAHPVGFTTISDGADVTWQRKVDSDGNVTELPHMRFVEEVISAQPHELGDAAIARELAEPRDANGSIAVTLLVKDGHAPIPGQTNTAGRSDHPRTMVGDQQTTGSRRALRATLRTLGKDPLPMNA
jgi:hypothetical protein